MATIAGQLGGFLGRKKVPRQARLPEQAGGRYPRAGNHASGEAPADVYKVLASEATQRAL